MFPKTIAVSESSRRGAVVHSLRRYIKVKTKKRRNSVSSASDMVMVDMGKDMNAYFMADIIEQHGNILKKFHVHEDKNVYHLYTQIYRVLAPSDFDNPSFFITISIGLELHPCFVYDEIKEELFSGGVENPWYLPLFKPGIVKEACWGSPARQYNSVYWLAACKRFKRAISIFCCNSIDMHAENSSHSYSLPLERREISDGVAWTLRVGENESVQDLKTRASLLRQNYERTNSVNNRTNSVNNQTNSVYNRNNSVYNNQATMMTTGEVASIRGQSRDLSQSQLFGETGSRERSSFGASGNSIINDINMTNQSFNNDHNDGFIRNPLVNEGKKNKTKTKQKNKTKQRQETKGSNNQPIGAIERVL